MPKKLVFLHGRAQEQKDAAALKQEWIASWKKGLDQAGLPMPIAETDIRFPYYGDTLDQLAAGTDVEEAAKVVIKGTADSAERDFIQDVLEEVRAKQGLDEDQVKQVVAAEALTKGPLNWDWVQGILKVIDRYVPLGSGAAVALATRDVYHYLTNPATKAAIENGVLAAMQPGEPTVFVSHSLGTVVAYNLLRREGAARNWQVPLFVTLGSPLAVKRIRQTLAPTKHPTCVQRWFNAFDERDVVSLYALQPPHFYVDPAITNKSDVDNHTRNRHGIDGYLSDPVVAKTVHDALL